jgi:hypothetical protein
MSAPGDLWSAWCSVCKRFVAEEAAEAQVRRAWDDHWLADHHTPELVR